MVAVMANMPVGDPKNNDTAVGGMVTRTQYERVESHIRKGIEEGRGSTGRRRGAPGGP
jgi:aldehyde dehydrogenase (NAD+)